METLQAFGHEYPCYDASPIASLRAENTVIHEVLRAITRALNGDGGFEDPSFWSDTLTFLQEFGDHHHRKEESVLFPRLEMRGFAFRGEPIGAMLFEHEQVRTQLRLMATLLPDAVAGGPGARERFHRAVSQYCEILAFHIAKEDGVLFPLAERLLSTEDAHDIEQRFKLLERKPGDARARWRLLALADRIRRAQ